MDYPSWRWGLSLIALTMAFHAVAVVMMGIVAVKIRFRLETRGFDLWALIPIMICMLAVIGLLLAVTLVIECGIWAAAYLWLEEREWVRRERAAVEAAGRERRIRVDSIRVDSPDLDFAKLDAFLAKTRVFPSYSHQNDEAVRPFLRAMKRSGFQVFFDEKISIGANWQNVIRGELEAAARDGWVVVFLSPRSISSDWVRNQMETGMGLSAKFILVMLEKIEPHAKPVEPSAFDATVDPTTAPDRLVELMLRLPV